MISPINSALAHARAGWRVLPLHSIGDDGLCTCSKGADCRSPGKHPRTENGIYQASRDIEQIESWWHKWPDANIGGRLDGLLALDVDIGPRRRAGKIVDVRGDLQLHDAEDKHGKVQRALVQNTGSGSQHILFRLPEGDVDYPAKLPGCRDVDLKWGRGAYIVLHGSNHESGGVYEWACGLDQMPLRLDLLPEVPEWFERSEGRASGDGEKASLSNAAHNRKFFRDFDELEDATMAVRNDSRFENRDEWLNFLAAIHFETDGSEDGRELAHEWSDTWHGGDDPAETDHVWDSFGNHENRRMKTGRTISMHAKDDGWKRQSVERDDDSAVEEEDPNEIDESDDTSSKATKILNRTHAHVMQAGKAMILNEEPDGGITWSRKPDFFDRYANDTRTVPGKPKANGDETEVVKSIAQIWFNHELRRQYNGIVMAPDGKAGTKYNLWRGFSVKPNKIFSCDRFITHIERNVCNGDKALSRWFIGWLADTVQRPQIKPGVAVALQGPRGAGKSVVGYVMGRLLAEHTIKVSATKHLTGNFNTHLSHAIFVRVEEAFWVGDRAGANVLKDLITGESVRIEPKGVDTFEVPSFHRFLLTSNEDWVVPAGMDERRFAVLGVGGEHAQDRAYFQAMLDELEHGGYGALLQYLLDYDLTDIDVGCAPITEALVEQKIASLHGVDKWWSEAVESGELPTPHSDEYDDWTEGGVVVQTKALYRHYETWLSKRRFEGDPCGPAVFTKKLRAWSPAIVPVRMRENGTLQRGLKLPILSRCRDDLDSRLGKEPE